jgi:hypothetical protein
MIIPALKLANTKAKELQRIKEFEEVALVEGRQRATCKRKPPVDLSFPLARGG